MSHELRTPLNAVIGFSEIIEDGTFGHLNEKQKKFVGHILESGRHLLKVINDILDLAKVEARKIEVHRDELDVKHLLQECCSTITHEISKRSLSLTCQKATSGSLGASIHITQRKRLRLEPHLCYEGGEVYKGTCTR